MATWNNELRDVWEQYLRDRQPTPLLAFLETHRQHFRPCGHEYPHLHRVCDIILEGSTFRLTRCFTCGESLSFKSIAPDTAGIAEDGVPYWLSGEKLAQWIEDISRHDPEEGTDWNRYK